MSWFNQFIVSIAFLIGYAMFLFYLLVVRMYE